MSVICPVWRLIYKHVSEIATELASCPCSMEGKGSFDLSGKIPRML